MISPAIRPQQRPTTTGTSTGRSCQPSGSIIFGFGWPFTTETWAKLMAIIAVAPTTEPELRSMPPEMITWVTPMAMMPMIETCRMMIDSRAVLKIEVAFGRVLNRNESPISSQPSASKTATIRTSAKKTLSSGGRCRFDASKVSPPIPCVV